MKIFKRGLLGLTTILCAFSFSNAQEEKEAESTMYAVHTDHVKFNMMPKYVELSKQFKESCEKHNVQDMTWTAISIEDGRFVYVTPIKNMAELDLNPMANLSKKMGKDKMAKMFEEMNTCYDSHNDEITYHKPKLSYQPEGYSSKGKDHRAYHFLYYLPKNGKKMKAAMAKVKDMFKAKGVKNGYQVYHSGFGSKENYYMVSISGHDDLDIAQGGKENDALLGDDKKATFFNVIKLTSKYDQVEGDIRRDLSYYPKN